MTTTGRSLGAPQALAAAAGAHDERAVGASKTASGPPPAAVATVGTVAAADARPLPPLAEAFLLEIATQQRVSAHTSTAYRRDLGMLVELFGEQLTALQPAAVRRCAARLHGRGLAPPSIARTLSAWRSFYRWLGRRGAVQSNPVIGVRAPRAPKRLPKALAVDQAVQLAGHAPQPTALALRDKAMIELMYSSGLRLAELVSVDWQAFGAVARAGAPGADARPEAAASVSWIDLAQREVVVTGKGSKRRSVPIGRAACSALQAWLAVRAVMAASAERALFVSQRGTRLAARSVHARLDQLAQKLGLGVHVHPHVLRHSMASHVLQSSGDLRAVQELLGHANISSTQIYTRLDWQHLAKAYDAAHPRARRKG